MSGGKSMVAQSARADVSIKEKYKKHSQMKDFWRQFVKNKAAVIGLLIFTVIILASLLADVIADYDTRVIAQDFNMRMAGPSWEHPFGTDEFGRDIFARVLHGSRLSLYVGLGSVLQSLLIGGIIGAISGYYGEKLDNVLMRIVDIFMAIPPTIMAITIMAALGSSPINLMTAIGISSSPTFARLMRSSVMTVRDMEFVEASRAIGEKNRTIIIREILPNCMAPMFVQITMSFAFGILNVCLLSFIGLGISPPTPEWGGMLASARDFMREAPHMMIFPGLAIVFTILSLNLLGDGLRDALDPKLKR